MNNFPSKDIRKNFLQYGGADDLNIYFKKLESLANRNNFYRNVYNEDIDFILSLEGNKEDNILLNNQTGGSFFDWLLGRKKKDQNEELYKQVTSVRVGTFCAVSTQKPESCKNEMEDRIDEVYKILKEGSDDNYKKGEIHRWKEAITDFIKFLYCCVDLYTANTYESFRKTIIIPIIEIIINNDDFLEYANEAIRIINHNENKKILAEYLAKLQSGEKLDESQIIKTHGFGLAYLTAIVNKITKKMIDRSVISK